MQRAKEDPVLVSARREAIVVLIGFLVAMTYTVVYCAQHAYQRSLDELNFVFGFPDWIFWGVVLPWSVCIAFSFLFGGLIMRDEDLGSDPESEASLADATTEEEVPNA